MDAEIVNALITATTHVVETMTSLKLDAQKPHVKQENKTWGVISGIISLVGPNLSGNMTVSFDQSSILEIVRIMLFEDHSEINDEVVDAVGEITNMICGNVKAQLSALGYPIEMATPMMVKGKGVPMVQLAKAPTIVLPFVTPHGEFVVETCVQKK